MATPTGRRNIRVTHRRLCIGDGQCLVGPAVAIRTRGSRRLGGRDLRVRAVVVFRLRIGVALRARDLLRRRLMHKALYVGVAIHARKHRAVHRVLQLARIHKQAVRLAVHVLTQRGVAVAREAVLIFQLVLRLKRPGQ